MFALNFQYFVYNQQNTWYNNGYKTGTTKVFLSMDSLLNELKREKNYFSPISTKELTEINIESDEKFLSFLNEKESKKEFVFYQLDLESYHSLRKAYEIEEEEDECFYNTFNFKTKTYSLSISQKHLLRIVCKKFEEGQVLSFSKTEQYEPSKLNIIKNVDYNKNISTERCLFRIGKEMDDLYYYWNKDIEDFYFPVPIQNNDNNNNNEVKFVHILELAFWIVQNTSCKDIESVIWLILSNDCYKVDLTLRMNTLLPDYTIVDAINNCCSEDDKIELLDVLGFE
jgi:hypothetical protein